ncbi:restriction endonuclease subunit S [Bacteroides caccae]|uniref:Restriction endonuclease subunit S n=2 Tax=Bacteroides caccae TaxID=47678 RepID=A0A6L3KUK0_9BACE|nr:restriction endonuclease subunit S [Bacteroides caccae]KAA5464104.1 restriction endonuclease subunit S [Bacteroides caccae]
MSSYYEKILATGEVKCIDEQVPFEIPQGWEWCRLGEISTYAQTKRKINASNADSQLWGLDLEDIEKGGRLLNIKTVGERKAIGDKTIFNRGDILYSKLRPYLLKILVAPEGGICTPEIIPFTCYGNICKDYIVSFLKSPYVDDYINSVTFGVKMPRVSTETMTSLLVPLPPLSEQFRIDTKTKDLMPYIDGYGKAQNKLNKLNEELSNTIRKSILQEAIQGKLVPQIGEEGTAKELLKQIKEEKLKLVKEGKLKKSALNDSVIFRGDDNKYYEQIGVNCNDITEEIPFDLPCNWCWCRFSNIVSMTIGKTPARGEQTYWINGKYNWVSISDMVDGGTISTTKEQVSDLAVKEIFSAPISEKGCLLMSFKLSIGKTSILDIDAYHNEAIITIRPVIDKEYAMRNYLFKVLPLIANLGESKDAIKGKTLNSKSLSNLLIPLPPLQEQQRIIERINLLSKQLR